MNKELKSVYGRAVDVWGVDKQIDMAIEEMSELTKALLKVRRSANKGADIQAETYDNVCEEIADVVNMVEQMRYIFDSEKIDLYIEQKLERTLEKIIKSENEQNSNTTGKS